MKYLVLIAFCLMGCTVEQEPVPPDSGYPQPEEPAHHEYNTNAPPKDNEPGGGCISRIMINGKLEILPCVPSEPHGPIYEFEFKPGKEFR